MLKLIHGPLRERRRKQGRAVFYRYDGNLCLLYLCRSSSSSSSRRGYQHSSHQTPRYLSHTAIWNLRQRGSLDGALLQVLLGASIQEANKMSIRPAKLNRFSYNRSRNMKRFRKTHLQPQRPLTKQNEMAFQHRPSGILSRVIWSIHFVTGYIACNRASYRLMKPKSVNFSKSISCIGSRSFVLLENWLRQKMQSYDCSTWSWYVPLEIHTNNVLTNILQDQNSGNAQPISLLEETKDLLFQYGLMMHQNPLQIDVSALIFSSLGHTFPHYLKDEGPPWIRNARSRPPWISSRTSGRRVEFFGPDYGSLEHLLSRQVAKQWQPVVIRCY